MKIILSRKGFDSTLGGCASPIFEDGSILSLPIPHCFASTPVPDPALRVNYCDVHSNKAIGKIVEGLTATLKKPVRATDATHLDPDLREESLPRKTGWRPLFGQADAAQRHLDKFGVGAGDIFLFFGWFKEVVERDGQFRFKRGARDLHLIFGWLEVGEVWRLGKEDFPTPDWAEMHPHIVSNYGPTNTVYVAKETRNGYSAGAFRWFKKELVLTAPERSRSFWRLPTWFRFRKEVATLSYHSNPARWRLDADCSYLQTVGRGQEFILDTNAYPQAEEWARRLISENSH